MADLEPHVPQAIEDCFGHLFAPGGLLVGQDEEQIDVGFRRHQPAAITAGRNHCHALGTGADRRAVEVLRCRRKQDADDLVLHEAQTLGAMAAVAVPEQHILRSRARRDQLRLQHLRHLGAENILASGVFFSQRVDSGRDPQRFETRVSLLFWMFHYNAIHDVNRYRTRPSLSLDNV